MCNISSWEGLPVKWHEETHNLEFFIPGTTVKPDIRRLVDMKEVLMKPEADGPEELYYMYRGVFHPNDWELAATHGLRYDITILRPGDVGMEPIKTAGHYHPIKSGTKITYPEIYEVLYGQACYLLQRLLPGREKVDRVVAIFAREGDKVLIPPHYGHITINPGPGFLIMSNWVEKNFKSVYEPIKKKRGGAYYAIREDDNIQFISNPNYPGITPLRYGRVVDIAGFGLRKEQSMYGAFLQDPTSFSFLTSPENFTKKFILYEEEVCS